ncbi:MAG: GGDEF domain-containing protein [Bacilli bacterium]|nr:GGDEF domain-containing protein [Bacilli bacterium]
MEMFKEYILQNWILILLLGAFTIILATTAFLDKKTTRRTYILIASIFLLSISVFIEFYFENDISYKMLRLVLMAIRYSATPFIIAQILFALVKRLKAFVFIPAGALLILNVVSIFTGIVFSINDENKLVRGPFILGYLPFIVVGLYCAFLIYILVRRSNKRAMEIIPIAVLAVAFISGLIFPFLLGADFSKIFCPTIAVAFFIYYVFQILQLTKKDGLTGLLNRQAYYAETSKTHKDITAIISLDMNGLKKINDTYGHDAGDEALVTLAICFLRACKVNQSVYRMGGDEFAIVCRKTSEEEVIKLIDRIHELVDKTKYTCSVGYSYQKDGFMNLDELLKLSDERMYQDKAEFYKNKQ